MTTPLQARVKPNKISRVLRIDRAGVTPGRCVELVCGLSDPRSRFDSPASSAEESEESGRMEGEEEEEEEESEGSDVEHVLSPDELPPGMYQKIIFSRFEVTMGTSSRSLHRDRLALDW